MFPVPSGDDEAPGPSFLEGYGPEAVNPLAIIGDDIVEALTPTQQKFLLARMVMATDAAAVRHIGSDQGTVIKWKREDENFLRAYKIIRADPINFALAVNRQIVQRAALEHMQLLQHPNIRVRQWAIDLAYRNQNIGGGKPVESGGETTNNFFVLMQQMLKQMPAETVPEETQTKELDGTGAGAPIEASWRPLNGGIEEPSGGVDQVRAES